MVRSETVVMNAGQSNANIVVKALQQPAEMDEAVELQKQIWGFEDVDLLPARLFVVATKIGGQAFGAYDGSRMVGYCLAIPGLKPGGRFYLHSHMLGVLDGYRDKGVGKKLKLAQRDDALARGVSLMEWTFDPLQIKNAFFNMERLGCVVRRYVRNQYGITSSLFDQGMPTDRCTAEWWLNHPRVVQTLAGTPPPKPPIERRIEVPLAMPGWRRDDPKRACEAQARISDAFDESFQKGLAVVGVERGEDAGTYLLGKWSPQE
ncbi:MAG: GNAT family N-acetyltransferase [Acidobacteriota bacterium]